MRTKPQEKPRKEKNAVELRGMERETKHIFTTVSFQVMFSLPRSLAYFVNSLKNEEGLKTFASPC